MTKCEKIQSAKFSAPLISKLAAIFSILWVASSPSYSPVGRAVGRRTGADLQHITVNMKQNTVNTDQNRDQGAGHSWQGAEHRHQGAEHWHQGAEHCHQGAEHWHQGAGNRHQGAEHCQQGAEHCQRETELSGTQPTESRPWARGSIKHWTKSRTQSTWSRTEAKCY
jgi:hypothetical protein